MFDNYGNTYNPGTNDADQASLDSTGNNPPPDSQSPPPAGNGAASN